jgi:hypothetical protein
MDDVEAAGTGGRQRSMAGMSEVFRETGGELYMGADRWEHD